MTSLAPGVEAHIAHLQGKTVDDLVSGRVHAPSPRPEPVSGVDAVDRLLSGTPPVRARRYEPAGPGEGPRPGLVWVHGGAWMYGTLDDVEADAVARRLCRRLDAVVVSVDYRLAPADPYPAAVEDVVAAFEAMAADPAVDPTRVALGGASAGGNIAAGAAQALRDRGSQTPAAVFLAYPATDPKGGPYPDERPDVCPQLLWFDPATTGFLFDVYLGGSDADAYAVPAEGTLAGLPPTLVTTSAVDALEAQAVRYTELLADAGVEVAHHRVEDMLHGYLGMCGLVPAADAALDRHAAWLEEQLS